MEIIDITRHSNSLFAVEKSQKDFDQVRSLDFSNRLRYIFVNIFSFNFIYFSFNKKNIETKIFNIILTYMVFRLILK